MSEIRSALAAEGIEVKREPPNTLGRCYERLSGQHAPETVNAALKAAFARARSEYGWQTGPDTGTPALTLAKGNWTVIAARPVTPAQGLQTPVLLSLTCLDGGTSSSGVPEGSATDPALSGPRDRPATAGVPDQEYPPA
ncbi:hypothetical protein ACIRFH_28505 [Streptomyces sp. NPDC093586]|uniref:hypothetical protein n=1 Tax=Streptomyces sp. NPDC093586 TaxID=3366042 RepID=UPI00380E8061